jgi:hypothetical protein
VAPTRRQKRWSGRLRTAGALLCLIGAVGLLDRLLPGSRESLGTLPGPVQLGIATAALALGALALTVGKRWR